MRKTFYALTAVLTLGGLAGCERSLQDEQQDVRNEQQEMNREVQDEQTDVQKERREGQQEIRDEQNDVDRKLDENTTVPAPATPPATPVTP